LGDTWHLQQVFATPLQFLHRIRATSSSESLHHLSFVVPLLLSPLPPGLLQGTFLAGSLRDSFFKDQNQFSHKNVRRRNCEGVWVWPRRKKACCKAKKVKAGWRWKCSEEAGF
jgi:hypothetical protein